MSVGDLKVYALSVLSLVGFLVAGIKSTGDGGDSGQSVALITAFVGMILSLILLIKPDRAAAR